MTNTSLTLALFLLLIAFCLHLFLYNQKQPESRSSRKTVPAVYIFGDSLFENGNNINLHVPPHKRTYKNTYLPYGIDFDGGKNTGRFTNGKIIPDYIALHLGLPLPPAYFHTSEIERSNITTGINYASAGCGILPEAGHKNGYVCLTFDNQIELFQETVEVYLKKQLKKKSKLKKHLSESLLLVNMGANDYQNSDAPRNYTPEAYTQLVLNRMSLQLQKLYNIGARKFLVNNLAPLGCSPASTVGMKPGFCNEEKNMLANSFNKNLPQMLQLLQSQLPGSTFVHSDLYKFILDIMANGEQYGIVDSWNPCCLGPVDGDCYPDHAPCTRRDTYLFFDINHPTDFVNKIYVTQCLNDVSICSPLNLKQLIEL